MADVKIPKGTSQEEVTKALALLQRQREQQVKQRERIKNNPELKTKQADRAKRLRVKNSLLMKKALAAGITCSASEIDKALTEE